MDALLDLDSGNLRSVNDFGRAFGRVPEPQLGVGDGHVILPARQFRETGEIEEHKEGPRVPCNQNPRILCSSNISTFSFSAIDHRRRRTVGEQIRRSVSLPNEGHEAGCQDQRPQEARGVPLFVHNVGGVRADDGGNGRLWFGSPCWCSRRLFFGGDAHDAATKRVARKFDRSIDDGVVLLLFLGRYRQWGARK